MICGASRWFSPRYAEDQERVYDIAMRLALAEFIPVIIFGHTYQMIVTQETVPSVVHPDVSEYRVLIRIEDMTR